MWQLEGPLGRALRTFSDYLVLNLLWLAGCLPLVTAPVSTAAMFEVIRQRQNGADPHVARSFVAAFRGHFRRGLAAGACFGAVGAVLVFDTYAVRRMDGPVGTVLTVAVYAALVIYALATVALFPTLVSFEARLGQVLRTAVLMPLVTPTRAVASLLVVGAAAVLVTSIPLTGLLAVAVAAGIVQRLYRRAFRRLAENAAAAAAGSA